ncbi:nuclear body protein SP140-like protein [Rhinichthys klamathensis goyatoka]|uniref:nuclear body protein SP140-like protein n=1 Tax=Rhinichthys klamathensis goyatoka TaxID=3034132 RepID=UPI0024B598B2|nr:nuclear body protein SP140-like protein [Rhinichthys klamathensis goyatoka]
MEKQNCKKRQLRGSSSLCTSEKKQAKRQNCPKSSAEQNESQLPVTCGYKEGFLHLKKYNNKQECIFSEGQWFKPTEFERFAGKERNKKWKTSILSNGIPLQKLIEKAFLSSKNFAKSKVQDAKVWLLLDGFRFDGGVNFLDWHCGRCIRTEDVWLSPGDFTIFNKPDGKWRKDIVAHGIPLGKLIMKRVLEPHMINCDQVRHHHHLTITMSEYQHDHQTFQNSLNVLFLYELLSQQNDDVCFVCDSEGDLVCCDKCPRAFHSHCHLPAVDGDSPGQWSCTFCVRKNMEDSSRKTQQDVLSSPVSQYTQHCQCLLLQLLHDCMTDSCTNVPGYSKNICGPMMLGRVKLKLENNDYQTVQEFVSDIRQIFNNFCTSSADNDSSRMTSRLKEVFNKEFETVFKLL